MENVSVQNFSQWSPTSKGFFFFFSESLNLLGNKNLRYMELKKFYLVMEKSNIDIKRFKISLF